MNIISELADCASPRTPAGSCRYDSSLGNFQILIFKMILSYLFSLSCRAVEALIFISTGLFRSFDKEVCRSI